MGAQFLILRIAISLGRPELFHHLFNFHRQGVLLLEELEYIKSISDRAY